MVNKRSMICVSVFREKSKQNMSVMTEGKETEEAKARARDPTIGTTTKLPVIRKVGIIMITNGPSRTKVPQRFESSKPSTGKIPGGA